MTLSRLDFLKGSFASLGFGAFGAGCAFAAPSGWRPAGDPLLVLGVMSDTHLRTRRSRKPTARWWPDTFLRAALEYFRDSNVDVVLHCGDMANYGEVEAIAHHLEVWREVFPGDRRPDGEKIELLTVTGNHDLLTNGTNAYVRKVYQDPVFHAQHILSSDVPGHWERIWGKPYEPVWHKEVKGYHFFGAQWGVDHGRLAKLVKEIMGKAPSESRPKPFFILTHARPLPPFRKSLAAYSRDALAFFGHNHISATNWNTIYYDEGSFPRIQVPPCISPDWDIKFKGDAYIAKAPLEGKDQTGRCRQGFVVKIYDEMMVIERREFAKGGSLGPDWVMMFGKAPHPFSKDELKKVIGEPQFKRGAALEICNCENVKLCNYGNMETKEIPQFHNSIIPQSHNLTIKIPLADGNPDSRVYAYEVVVIGDEGTQKLFKAVYAAGCNMGIGHEPNGGVTTLEITEEELSKVYPSSPHSSSSITIAVRPLSSLGTFGAPIVAKVKW